MTDIGNTGFQVAPKVNEQEINMVRDVFERMAQAVVGISGATQEIASIREELASLKRDIETTQARNRELDEMVTHVRRERDEAVRERDEARLGEARSSDSVRMLEDEISRVRNDLETAQADLLTIRRERDDMGFRQLELDENIAKIASNLEEMRQERDYWKRQHEAMLDDRADLLIKLENAKRALGCMS